MFWDGISWNKCVKRARDTTIFRPEVDKSGEKRPKVTILAVLREKTTLATFCTFAQKTCLRAGVLARSDTRGKRNPGYSCPAEGQEAAQSWILSGWEQGCGAKSTKVAKVLISHHSSRARSRTPTFRLPPPRSRTRLIKGVLDPALSDCYPITLFPRFPTRARTLEEASQGRPGKPGPGPPPTFFGQPEPRTSLFPHPSTSSVDRRPRTGVQDGGVAQAVYQGVLPGPCYPACTPLRVQHSSLP